jgi:hypothetical protein
MFSTLAISMCISKMKTFLQTYPVEMMQNVFVALASPCQSKPLDESPGFSCEYLSEYSRLYAPNSYPIIMLYGWSQGQLHRWKYISFDWWWQSYWAMLLIFCRDIFWKKKTPWSLLYPSVYSNEHRDAKIGQLWSLSKCDPWYTGLLCSRYPILR